MKISYLHKTITLIAITLCSLLFTSVNSRVFFFSNSASPPQLTVYVESLCPDTMKFETTSFKDFFNNPSKADLVSGIEFIPFGNASESEGSKEGKRIFTCQHGEKECYGNKIQNCVIKHEYTQSQDFLMCFASHVLKVGRDAADLDQITNDCLDNSAAQEVLDCAKGVEGGELLHESGLKTGSHNYIPYIIVNGEHTQEIQDFAEFNLVGYLCKFNDLEGKVPGCTASFTQNNGFFDILGLFRFALN